MTIGQYLLLAAVTYTTAGLCCYFFMYKPALRKIYDSTYSAEPPETDTAFFTGRLYRIEGDRCW